MKMKLAVIAHDGKKAEMVAFLNRHHDFMSIKYKWYSFFVIRLENIPMNRMYKC